MQRKNEENLTTKTLSKGKKCEVKKCNGNTANEMSSSCTRAVHGKYTREDNYICLECK